MKSSASDSSPTAPLDYMNLETGTLLNGKYQVQMKLGKGGFGCVYKVIDVLGDVTRALKIVTADRGSTSERMKQEYRTLGNLPDHPSVVRVYDGAFLDGDRTPILVMEFVEGANVEELIKEKKISLTEVLKMGSGVADGLAHIHRHNVTHGDISLVRRIRG